VGRLTEAIAETIRVGINSAHPNSRNSQMPAFGRDTVLKRDEMDNVVAYVRSLSNPKVEVPAASLQAGKAVFAANCAACHGPEAKGNVEVGAPNLTMATGSTARTRTRSTWQCGAGCRDTCRAGRAALALDRKILALYLVDLRKSKP